MKSEIAQKMESKFDDLAQTVPDEGIEFWFARDLQEPLGYARWENFMTAIQRAIESCETPGYEPNNYFRGVTKMGKLGSGAADYNISSTSAKPLFLRKHAQFWRIFYLCCLCQKPTKYCLRYSRIANRIQP